MVLGRFINAFSTFSTGGWLTKRPKPPEGPRVPYAAIDDNAGLKFKNDQLRLRLGVDTTIRQTGTKYFWRECMAEHCF